MELLALNLTNLMANLPPRKANAHKGDFGHVLVIGGDYGYPGAPVLAALGALRVGAGLVTIASRRDNLLGLNAGYPEIMSRAIDQPDELVHLFPKASVIVLGPGLGRSAWSEEIFKLTINTRLPLVLDADGLFFFRNNNITRTDLVITPHPGEAAALLQQTVSTVQAQRLTTIQNLINITQATVVLKGAGTLVGSQNKPINICNAGNPGMASGGMGDLLSGMIAGLIAQGLSLDLSAKLAVCVHALAGDQAAIQGHRGLLATDLLPEIRNLMG